MKLMRSKNISNICIQGKSNMELIAKNYLQFISCSFLMLIVIAFWKFPLSAPVLAIAFLLVSLMTAVWLIIKKYRKSYLEGKLTRGIFVRNVVSAAVWCFFIFFIFFIRAALLWDKSCCKCEDHVLWPES